MLSERNSKNAVVQQIAEILELEGLPSLADELRSLQNVALVRVSPVERISQAEVKALTERNQDVPASRIEQVLMMRASMCHVEIGTKEALVSASVAERIRHLMTPR